MKFLSNWRTILKRAWSVRLLTVAALLSGIEAALPFLDSTLPQGVFAALSALVTVGAFVARFVVQQGVSENEDRQKTDSGA